MAWLNGRVRGWRAMVGGALVVLAGPCDGGNIDVWLQRRFTKLLAIHTFVSSIPCRSATPSLAFGSSSSMHIRAQKSRSQMLDLVT